MCCVKSIANQPNVMIFRIYSEIVKCKEDKLRKYIPLIQSYKSSYWLVNKWPGPEKGSIATRDTAKFTGCMQDTWQCLQRFKCFRWLWAVWQSLTYLTLRPSRTLQEQAVPEYVFLYQCCFSHSSIFCHLVFSKLHCLNNILLCFFFCGGTK